MENAFDTRVGLKDLRKINALIGSQYNFVGGAHFPELCSSDVIVFSTSQGSLRFQGDIVEANFEGYKENYSTYVIQEAEPGEVSKLVKRGRVATRDVGSQIKNVYVLSSKRTELKRGEKTWVLYSTRGVIFDFGNSKIAISKLGEHDECLTVTHLDGGDFTAIPETSSFFESDEQVTYVIEESLETISSLIEKLETECSAIGEQR